MTPQGVYDGGQFNTNADVARAFEAQAGESGAVKEDGGEEAFGVACLDDGVNVSFEGSDGGKGEAVAGEVHVGSWEEVSYIGVMGVIQ